MDRESVAGYASQLSTAIQAGYVAGLLHPTAVIPSQRVEAQPSLQAASERAKTDAQAQPAVQPTSGTCMQSSQQMETACYAAAQPLVGPLEAPDRQSAQPVVTAQLEHQAPQQSLRRSARERRKPAVLAESADEAALTAAESAATGQQSSANKQDDPFGDLMLLIDAAAALSTDAGLLSPVAQQAARAGSVPGSHQSSSNNSHEYHAAVAAPQEAAAYATCDAANGMAALSVHSVGSSAALDVTGRAASRSRKAQAGRSSSKQPAAAAGLPPTASHDRMSTPPADPAAGAAHASRGNRGSSSRRNPAGSAARSAGQSRLGDAAATPVVKRSSEMTGSLPNLKPRGQGRWQVFLCAQGLKYLYVGQYDDLASAKHARDLAVLAVHGPRLVPTLNPIESYTQDQIAVVRQQMAEKPAARAVMVTNGLWPPAGQDITLEQLQQEKRSRRLPGLQHLVPLHVRHEGHSIPGSELGSQACVQDPAEAAATADHGQLSTAAGQQVDLEAAAAGAAAGSTKAPRMRASVATTLALAAAAASTGGSSVSSQIKMEHCGAGGSAAAAAAVAASLQHYHARATANPTGTTGIREHKGVFEVFLATPPFKYLYVGRAPTLQQAVHLKATAILAIYGPHIAQDQFSIDLNSITSDEVQIMAGKLANKPAALAAMRQYGTDVLHLQPQQYGGQQQHYGGQQQQFEQQQQLDLQGSRYSSRDSDAGSHNLDNLGPESARILAAAVAAAAAMCEDDSVSAGAVAGSCRKRSAAGTSDAGSTAAAAGASGDVDDLFAAAAAAALKRRNLGSSSGGGSSGGGGSTTTAHSLQDLLDCLQQQYHTGMADAQVYHQTQAAAAPAEVSADIDQALAAMAAAAAIDHQEEGDAEASLTVCPRNTPLHKYESTTLASPVVAAAAAPGATGVAGVRAHKGGYEAFIGSPPFKYLYIGLYKTLQEAVRAKDTAMMVLYGALTANGMSSSTLAASGHADTTISTEELRQMAVKLSKKPQAVQAMKRAGTYHLVSSAQQDTQYVQQQQQQQGDQGLKALESGFGVSLQAGVVFEQQQQQQGCIAGDQKEQQQQLHSEGSDQMEVDVLPDLHLQQQQQQVEVV